MLLQRPMAPIYFSRCHPTTPKIGNMSRLFIRSPKGLALMLFGKEARKLLRLELNGWGSGMSKDSRWRCYKKSPDLPVLVGTRKSSQRWLKWEIRADGYRPPLAAIHSSDIALSNPQMRNRTVEDRQLDAL